MIKYIGSKRVLIPTILEVVDSLPEVDTVVDFFSGTSRVGHALKRAGYRVHANDWMAYASELARCYVAAEASEVRRPATELLEHLQHLPPVDGYFTETFCRRSRFFQPQNGMRVDAAREEIERLGLDPDLRAVVLVALMEAADRVDSTTGVQMAYLKEWAPRSYRGLELRLPDVLDRVGAGRCTAHRLEARDAAASLRGDVAYIDPPYNRHSYLGNYHIWETLIAWDAPETFGVACKRVDCQTRKSDFNSKPRFEEALRSFIGSVDARYLIVSFNDEGYLDRECLESLLRERGDVHVVARDHKRYVGVQIGIHNQKGERVGEVGRLRNVEFFYVVVPVGTDWTPTRVDGPTVEART